MSEWLDIMLSEIARKRAEQEAARQEAERRAAKSMVAPVRPENT